MKQQTTKKRSAVRIAVSMLTALVLCFGLIRPWNTALATTSSLPNIETIVSTKSTYNILEIVPQEGSGTLGYYVDKQEPCSGWMNNLEALTSPALRETYAEALFGNLYTAGILGRSSSSGNPMYTTNYTVTNGYYLEKFYWELGGSVSDYTVMTLDNYETKSVTGAFLPSSDHTGRYLADRVYTISPGRTGDSVQEINHFTYGDAGSGYYYNPVFTEITTGATELIGQAIYEKTDGGTYTFLGILGSEELPGLRVRTDGKYYYYVSETGAAFAAFNAATAPYAATVDGYKAVSSGTGTFASTLTGTYELLSTQSGDYNFNNYGTQNGIIRYDTVYIKCGYVNNNWFIKNVFDQSDTSAIRIMVRSIAAPDVTPELIESADLIYLSGGMNATFSASLASLYAASTNDLSSEAGTAMSEVASGQTKPFILDLSLLTASAATQMKTAAALVRSTASLSSVTHGVKNCVYLFGSDSKSGALVTCLATSRFTTAFSDTTNFSDVLDEIEMQNFLRSLDNYEVEPLASIVSYATILRHIINYANLGAAVKDDIRVLEIEPTSNYELTASQVLTWLGNPDSLASGDVTITHMSTSEFIGKIENLNEKYDLVYIGNEAGNISSFNSDDLLYANIGKSYTLNTGSTYTLAGMLNSDYTSTARTQINTSSSTLRTFRFSGNDLTSRKATELQNFVSAGYPIVIADGLMSPTASNTSITYHPTLTVTKTVDKKGRVTLTAAVTDVPAGSTVSYEWYQYKSGRWRYVSDSTSIAGNSNETYCYASVIKDDQWVELYTTDFYQNSATFPITVSDTMTFTSTSYQYTTAGEINTDYMDSCSKLYTSLEDIKGYANVLTVSEAEANSVMLLKYLNLSKPEINLTSWPTVYKDAASSGTGVATSMQPDADGNYYLEYQFTITNPTDATPASTTYDCSLAVDVNADGRYAENEELGDIQIYKNGTIVQVNEDEFYELKAGASYTLIRQVPSSLVGIIPWQLEIVKNGAPHIHASVQKFTRIAATTATKAKINVLQLNGWDEYNDYTGEINLETNQVYQSLIGQINDFSIRIKTVQNSSTAFSDSTLGISSVNLNTGTKAGIYAALSKYDMLIIGFADCYNGISTNLASAITDYINAGKSVLFTHDTTSFVNANSATVSNFSYLGVVCNWGYSFNTIIRDAVGLDRYGITSQNATIKSLIQGGGNLSSSQASTVTNGGYSIAYSPNSASNATLNTTQGFSNYSLMTNLSSFSSLNSRTNTVTQENEGQITTYPFNINKGNMTVSQTHEQYYQVNMENDDIVVWYCLAGDRFLVDNDVANAYYIYTRGNVTYSGVGHADTSNPTTDEAKLFINTMIASYQSAYESPSVGFVMDSSGSSSINTKYFTADNWSAQADVLNSADRTMYYTISDPNLTSQTKTISAEFLYAVGSASATTLGGATSFGSASALKSGRIYTLTLPGAVFTALRDDDVSVITVYVKVTEVIGTGDSAVTLTGYNTLELRKIGLFSLD